MTWTCPLFYTFLLQFSLISSSKHLLNESILLRGVVSKKWVYDNFLQSFVDAGAFANKSTMWILIWPGNLCLWSYLVSNETPSIRTWGLGLGASSRGKIGAQMNLKRQKEPCSARISIYIIYYIHTVFRWFLSHTVCQRIVNLCQIRLPETTILWSNLFLPFPWFYFVPFNYCESTFVKHP